MLCTSSWYRFERALITPRERAAGLATDMHILLEDLFSFCPVKNYIDNKSP